MQGEFQPLQRLRRHPLTGDLVTGGAVQDRDVRLVAGRPGGAGRRRTPPPPSASDGPRGVVAGQGGRRQVGIAIFQDGLLDRPVEALPTDIAGLMAKLESIFAPTFHHRGERRLSKRRQLLANMKREAPRESWGRAAAFLHDMKAYQMAAEDRRSCRPRWELSEAATNCPRRTLRNREEPLDSAARRRPGRHPHC
jgi:hypothetical protein